MKFTTALVLTALLIPVPSFAGGTTKEVCKMVATKKVCKKIKTHKKLNGTKVPTKK